MINRNVRLKSMEGTKFPKPHSQMNGETVTSGD